MISGARLIRAEREHQISKHGFTGKHHYEHPEWYAKGQLLDAARTLTLKNSEIENTQSCPTNWNIDWWIRLTCKPYEERIVIAGALIAAEIDRLNWSETAESEKALKDSLHKRDC